MNAKIVITNQQIRTALEEAVAEANTGEMELLTRILFNHCDAHRVNLVGLLKYAAKFVSARCTLKVKISY